MGPSHPSVRLSAYSFSTTTELLEPNLAGSSSRVRRSRKFNHAKYPLPAPLQVTLILWFYCLRFWLLSSTSSFFVSQFHFFAGSSARVFDAHQLPGVRCHLFFSKIPSYVKCVYTESYDFRQVMVRRKNLKGSQTDLWDFWILFSELARRAESTPARACELSDGPHFINSFTGLWVLLVKGLTWRDQNFRC